MHLSHEDTRQIIPQALNRINIFVSQEPWKQNQLLLTLYAISCIYEQLNV